VPQGGLGTASLFCWVPGRTAVNFTAGSSGTGAGGRRRWAVGCCPGLGTQGWGPGLTGLPAALCPCKSRLVGL